MSSGAETGAWRLAWIFFCSLAVADLHYAPLPEALVKRLEKKLDAIEIGK